MPRLFRRSRIGALLLAVTLSLSASLFRSSASSQGASSDPDRPLLAKKLLADHFCPCGCGRRLPGSSASPACFGCSVGKAEVAFVRESLAAGHEPVDIILRLNETLLVDVFADYTDRGLAETWERAVRVSGEFDQHRVVLRTPGESRAARRAVALAECARVEGHFRRVQALLIGHRGPWDDDALLRLAAREGLEPAATRQCMERVDVGSQIAKDREHAEERGMRAFPAVSVNRSPTADTDRALRQAIREVLLEESL
jgi:hypothetical protein